MAGIVPAQAHRWRVPAAALAAMLALAAAQLLSAVQAQQQSCAAFTDPTVNAYWCVPCSALLHIFPCVICAITLHILSFFPHSRARAGNCTACIDAGCGFCLSTLTCLQGQATGPADNSICAEWQFGSSATCPGTCCLRERGCAMPAHAALIRATSPYTQARSLVYPAQCPQCRQLVQTCKAASSVLHCLTACGALLMRPACQWQTSLLRLAMAQCSTCHVPHPQRQ